MQNASNPAESYRWDDLRFFLALFRERTLSGAAAALGVNASTVGRRIDGLEEALDARLFDRTPDGASVTAAGETLVTAAEDMERAAIRAAGAASGFEREPVGTVRITAPPGVVDFLLADMLVEIRQRYPQLCVELDSSVGYADLTRREADIALRTVRPRSGDLVARKLPGSPYAVLALPAIAGKRRLKDPAALPWITWGPELAHLSTGQWMAEQVPADRIALRTNSMTAQIRAAEAGLGAVLQPVIYAEVSGLSVVPVTRPLGETMPATDDVWLVGHRALRHVPRVAVVWDLISERFDVG